MYVCYVYAERDLLKQVISRLKSRMYLLSDAGISTAPKTVLQANMKKLLLSYQIL